MMKVFWDSNLFIYLFEDYGELTALVQALWHRMVARGDVLVTSSMSLGEVLAGIPADHREVWDLWRTSLPQIADVYPFGDQAALRYAVIRRDRTIRQPDAIQLACAAEAGATLFVTNDERLTRKVVPGVPVLTSLRGVPI
jgi:uncharacterized protein